ncbi:MAG: S41 family peptidase [Lachnospiraceae bacterium]|nr:S41 family peptidase [Lachnospiraceae bacterium]
MDYNEEILPAQNAPVGEVPSFEKPPKKGGFLKGLLVGILCSACIFALIGGVLAQTALQLAGNDVVDGTTRAKLSYLSQLIHQNFYQDVDNEALEEGLYHGLVEGLDDPYSEYYSEREYEDFQINTTGSYAGIGAQLSQDKETMVVTITKVYPDSPAEKAGLRAQDRIISVDDHKATEEKLEDFVQRIRGEEGTSMNMVYMRKDEEKTAEITRANVIIPSVSYKMLEDGIGLIEISEFASNTREEFDEAVAALEEQGLKAIIYDLRANPGGMVLSVTDILDEILPEGTTVYMVDKQGEKTTYSSDEEHKMDYPIVVLTSENSASAAEIFAGAIRDYKYGILIGKKTYGKGVVQSTFPLSDGSAVKMTIASYYTPSGKSIHEKGIKPDIDLDYKYTGDVESTEYDYSKDNQVRRAIKELKKELDK